LKGLLFELCEGGIALKPHLDKFNSSWWSFETHTWN